MFCLDLTKIQTRQKVTRQKVVKGIQLGGMGGKGHV